MVVKKLKYEKENYGSSAINPDAFLILDDCLYDSSWTRDTNIPFYFYEW